MPSQLYLPIATFPGPQLGQEIDVFIKFDLFFRKNIETPSEMTRRTDKEAWSWWILFFLSRDGEIQEF